MAPADDAANGSGELPAVRVEIGHIQIKGQGFVVWTEHTPLGVHTTRMPAKTAAGLAEMLAAAARRAALGLIIPTPRD